MGLFLPLDDALLSRACATALPAETSDEQALNRFKLVRDDMGITRQALFRNDTMNLDGGLAAEEESGVQNGSDIIKSVKLEATLLY